MTAERSAGPPTRRPNVLFIIADDLGYSDIGCYGAEIATPALDALAADGTRMLNYHTAAACSPTRAMVMSGTDAHLAGLGCLLEYKSNPWGARRWGGKEGHEGFLNHRVAALPEILQDNFYATVLSGKWHLGLRPENGPQSRGFDHSFAMLPGCCNHYGWEPVLEQGYPGNKVGGRPIHVEEGRSVKIEPNTNNSAEGFYSSDYYTDKFIGYLEGLERSASGDDKPWFGYLAYSAPHWPLQAPKDVRDKYRGRYDAGPYALREARLKRLVELGIVDADVVPHDVVHPEGQEWDSFTPYEKACSVRAMEAYAAMVDRMDWNIGRVVDYLRQTGQYDDTMIVFMSDNGAEGAALEAIPVLGENIKAAIHEYYDNSLENIGEWNSYTWLGPLWAQASTAPSRLYKLFPSQGGILVPAIVKPAANTFPTMPKGGTSRVFTTCMDLAPTVLELAGIAMPDAEPDERGRGRVVHRGEVVLSMTGCSWVPWFGRGERVAAAEPNANGEANGTTTNGADVRHPDEWAIYPSTRAIGWELHAMAALRKGDWKIVHLKQSHGGKSDKWDSKGGWELFNVSQDPGETVDLGPKYPAKLAELLAHWDEYVADVGLVWGPGAMSPGLPPGDAPQLWDEDTEMQRTWIQVPAGEKASFDWDKVWGVREGWDLR